MGYGIYNELVTGANLNQHSHHWAASHCRRLSDVKVEWRLVNMSRTPRVLCVRIGCIRSFCIAKVFIIRVTTTISHVGWFCDCNTMFSDYSSCLIQQCIEDVGGVSSNKNLHFVLRVKALLATCL